MFNLPPPRHISTLPDSKRIADDTGKWGKVIRAANIKPD